MGFQGYVQGAFKLLNFNNLIGKPFNHGSKGPDSYDCYGLCREVLRRVGIYIPDKDRFEDLTMRHSAIEQGKSQYTKLEGPEPFSMVTFKLRGNYVTHMGIVLEDGRRFIHILKSRCVAIERLDNIVWKAKIDGFYKYNA